MSPRVVDVDSLPALVVEVEVDVVDAVDDNDAADGVGGIERGGGAPRDGGVADRRAGSSIDVDVVEMFVEGRRCGTALTGSLTSSLSAAL